MYKKEFLMAEDTEILRQAGFINVTTGTSMAWYCVIDNKSPEEIESIKKALGPIAFTEKRSSLRDGCNVIAVTLNAGDRTSIGNFAKLTKILARTEDEAKPHELRL